MSVLANSAVIGGDVNTGDIGHSLRFRGAQYFSRVFASGDRAKWAFSCWLKKDGPVGTASSSQTLLATGSGSSDSGSTLIAIDNDNIILSGYTTLILRTSTLLRDYTGWVHIYVWFDQANATQNLRAGIKINGVEASYATDNRSTLSGASTFGINTGILHTFGAWSWNGGTFAQPQYLKGYAARIAFVGGSIPAVTEFITFNTEINEWVTKTESEVKAVVDAGGTNSFMLEFKDATSLTTLGYDNSSKGNNWTLNNFSLTAGPTYDWMLDVPGNSYATLNPIYPSAANITNGNLSSGTTAARATLSSTIIDSQWFVTAGASAVTAGVIDDAGTTNTTTVTANKVFAFKMTTTGSLSYKNVTDAGSWTSIATGLTGNRWPYSITQAASWNFGQQPLPEALDSGFKALCQANLSDSGTVIVSGSFTGNVSADGPCIWMNGTPKTLTINSNAVTFGTHADRLATGFKIRTASTSYNSTGTNTWTATIDSNLQNIFKYNNGQGNP